MFSVVPHRLPKIRPCGFRQQRGTPNLRHTSVPPPFTRWTPFGLDGKVSLSVAVDANAVAMPINQLFKLANHLLLGTGQGLGGQHKQGAGQDE